MSIDFKNCTEEELWKFVASELSVNGVDVVLVGGAVVSIYTEGAYRSGDLDFVLNDLSRKKLEEVMNKIGFIKDNRFYKHPECKHLFIEFTSFPVSIGDDYKINPEEKEFRGTIIKILSPTDCVRDRLASYIYFGARECLDQALMVAKKHPVNLKKIKDWCESENAFDKWSEFLNKLPHPNINKK